jgi:hypothetical protein
MENITRVFSEKGKVLLILNDYTFYKDRIIQIVYVKAVYE